MPGIVMRHTAASKAVGDATAWVVGILAAEVVRHNLSLHGLELTVSHLVLVITIVACIHVTIGVATGLYRNQWRFGSFDELGCVAMTTLGTLGAAFLLWLLAGRRLAPGVLPFAAAAAALLTMTLERFGWRTLEQRRLRPSALTARRMIVVGAGEGATQLLWSVLRNPRSSHLPVALLDDDPGKRNFRIMGVRVVGTSKDLAEAAARYDADLVVLAIPSAGADLVRQTADTAGRTGLEVRVLPTTAELLGGRATFSDLRSPTISDLLGRRPVSTDLTDASRYLTGRRVLVTGAGGSIGSELCRQLQRLGPAELMMLDRDESALHAVQLSVDGRGMLDSPDLILADIRDAGRIADIFAARRPDVVFHAAALKHLSLLEAHPAEAVKSNVVGTLNVIDAARRAGVAHFVNISTDKAADPASCLGFSKRITERLTADAARHEPGSHYLSVRFGNVLGSRGSALHAFRSQIEAGGPVLVTDPRVTRFFMTTEEAVQLVIQAGAVGDAGRVLVLDMGEPVSIADMAERVVRESGRPVAIAYTGLRPGEKLHEDLFGRDERRQATSHELITQVDVPPLHPADALALPTGGHVNTVRAALQALAVSATDTEVIDVRADDDSPAARLDDASGTGTVMTLDMTTELGGDPGLTGS